MKAYRWQLGFGLALVALSVFFYGLHFLFFHDMHHILIYLVGDIAFLPAEVLLVSLVIHELLALREKRARRHKFNIVLGIFFSEVGASLMTLCRKVEENAEEQHKLLKEVESWSNRDFDKTRSQYTSRNLSIACTGEDLMVFRDLLLGQHDFLLRLLENPSLLEHESFTDLLWAVFHLSDELQHRTQFDNLPQGDLKHLAGDIKRAYQLLIIEWLGYMKHLKNNYPYLFSLAVRTSPFNPDASAEVS